jgi:hypothetical protein
MRHAREMEARMRASMQFQGAGEPGGGIQGGVQGGQGMGGSTPLPSFSQTQVAARPMAGPLPGTVVPRSAAPGMMGGMRGGAPLNNVGRNDPCPCGSGKKYKKCHGQEA